MAELEHYLGGLLRPAESESFPLNWAGVFGRSAPLGVEIGFGNGEFLDRWSKDRPDWNFIGIEISMESAKRGLKRIQDSALQSTRVIHDDARFVLRECFADNSVSHVMMNFPDPWPKERHKKHRLLDEQFIETLSAIVVPGGYYELVTDQEWYAEYGFSLFEASQYFSIEHIEENPRRPVTTKYESKWLSIGRSTYRILAKKHAYQPIIRILEDPSMPHAFVEGDIQADHFRELSGFKQGDKKVIFAIKSVFQQLATQNYLVRVVASDNGYRQKFFVVVKREISGRWLVKLDTTVSPYRTNAVKEAVRKIGELLQNACTATSR